MESNTFIASLLKPLTNKSSSRKAWSIDLETVWLPFFTASNAVGSTAIPPDALGCPLRLGYNPDGSVKFGKTGKPDIRIAKELNSSVRMVRENFIAGLQSYSHKVYTEQTDLYKNEVARCIKAGKPIIDHDHDKLTKAMSNLLEQAKVESDRQAKIETDKATVKEALAHAEQEQALPVQGVKAKVK